MFEHEVIPSYPQFEDIFSSMSIPGETGIAVSRVTLESRSCIAIGRSNVGFTKMLSKGEPLQIISSKPITADEYESIVLRLGVGTPKNGLVGAEEILDGEAYFFKWQTSKCEFRFMLCNPCEIESDYYKNMGYNLGNFFKSINRWRSVFSLLRFCQSLLGKYSKRIGNTDLRL